MGLANKSSRLGWAERMFLPVQPISYIELYHMLSSRRATDFKFLRKYRRYEIQSIGKVGKKNAARNRSVIL